MTRRRVVITGLGVITSLGETADELWENVCAGKSGISLIEEQNKVLIERGVGRVSPFTVPRLMANAGSGNVSILFRINGPNTTVATACATGSNAIGDAARFIQWDQADVMIAGGSQAALCP